MSQTPSHHAPSLEHAFLTRRELLNRVGMGMGGLALGSLFSGPQAAAATLDPLAVRRPHFEPKAKRVVHFFMNGGPSQVDTFDPKPMLDKYDGKALPNVLKTERPTGAGFKSPFQFAKHGQCGLEVSELFPKLAAFADDLCVIRSMYADVPNHEPSLGLMNSGEGRLNRPTMGSWVTYGLGSENKNLPGYIAMCPGGMPTRRTKNWQAAFLPSAYQGAYINTEDTRVEKLVEFIQNGSLDLKQQRRQLDLLQELNQKHLIARERDQQLEARVQSYELAYRMQMEATDAFDVDQEPAHIRKAYGEGPQNRQLLIARRLVERGVRFVQTWHGNLQPWDSHSNIRDEHRKVANECDQGLGALITDLKQRGMLESTLILCTGEFGRTPSVEMGQNGSGAAQGRDHNHWGFSLWMAGGGIKGGTIHGATDDFGFRAVENPVSVHDLHATMLHLLGFDHERLTFRHAGRDFRLTDVFGNVVREVIAAG